MWSWSYWLQLQICSYTHSGTQTYIDIRTHAHTYTCTLTFLQVYISIITPTNTQDHIHVDSSAGLNGKPWTAPAAIITPSLRPLLTATLIVPPILPFTSVLVTIHVAVLVPAAVSDRSWRRRQSHTHKQPFLTHTMPEPTFTAELHRLFHHSGSAANCTLPWSPQHSNLTSPACLSQCLQQHLNGPSSLVLERCKMSKHHEIDAAYRAGEKLRIGRHRVLFSLSLQYSTFKRFQILLFRLWKIILHRIAIKNNDLFVKFDYS